MKISPLLLVFVLVSFFSKAQEGITLRNDSLFMGKKAIGIILTQGFGCRIVSPAGLPLFSIAEGGFHFEKDKSAWVSNTYLSKERILNFINKYKLFGEGGLNNLSVKIFISKYPTQQTVLTSLRTTPISIEDE
jgi:hypothetical protein